MVALLLVLLVGLTFLLSRTAFGRHVYAVGGNAEAARRAGINVPAGQADLLHHRARRSRRSAASCWPAGTTPSRRPPAARTPCSTRWARRSSAAPASSAARARSIDAVLGGLVIAVIINGMGLLNQPSSVVYMVTGVVLLVAASVDALSRRRAAASGRAVTGPRCASSGATTQEEVRRQNLGAVLTQVHRAGPLTRAELTARLGLNRSTIGALTAELVAAGIVRESVPAAGDRVGRRVARAGRPSLVVAPEAGPISVLAVDVGVERIAAARVGLGGRVLDRLDQPAAAGRAPTSSRSLARVVAMARALLDRTGPGTSLRRGGHRHLPGWCGARTAWSGWRPTSSGSTAPLGRVRRRGAAGRSAAGAGRQRRRPRRARRARPRRRGQPRTTSSTWPARPASAAASWSTGGRCTATAGTAGEVGHLVVNPTGRLCRCGNRGLLGDRGRRGRVAGAGRARAGRRPGGGARGARRGRSRGTGGVAARWTGWRAGSASASAAW